ncbi:Zn-dependent hydrolase [Muricoccus pecuniae]|uniref:N-carbamoyl-L-amino-acid hydrolase n=1 Tax=Muricoccus pecuniae TaxID=693023 RepID=A0A840Y5N9_9PROT|nr:Zn-dependent hydrolase [Roseomonas pecuniae]MBB5695466.1 N-carbamoyl-L-amino-acid hydrolase [Roseomonas pecuniae]
MTPRIDADRLWRRLMALAEIGALLAGGVNRQALSPAEIEAWRLVIAWGAEAGMEPSTDPAGNLFLTLPGRDRTLPPLVMGSHLDTQPTGGKFDGAFGVLAGLEAAQSLGATPARDVTVVGWMNEEGSRFAPGMMGSEAFAGVRSLDEILGARDAGGTSVAEALAALHAAFPDMPRRPLGFPIAFYLEPHIEQGPVLEQRGTPIGIVTGIQGKKTWEMVVGGEEGHAGTLDMADRRDALAAFARMADAMFREVGTIDPAIKFTIGMVRMEPNAPSVVPARLTFRIDLRHPNNAVLHAAGDRLEALAQAHAPPCTVRLKRLVDAPSNDFDADLRARIAVAAEALGHAATPILSAAGHDARHMAPLCPAAMIFIPCRDGVSHAEHEWAEPAHVAAGAAVLAEVAAGLVLEHAE